MIGKCCACDVRLTVEQCRTDAEMCPGCRREHEEGYAANRVILIARLIGLLMMLQVRRYLLWGETAEWMMPMLPKALWISSQLERDEP